MIILNERKFAEECLEKGEMLSTPFQTLSILARYYYYIKNYKPKQIRQSLSDFLKKAYFPYAKNEVYDSESTFTDKWDDIIDKIVKKVKKFKLYETEPIPITEAELKTIGQINSIKLEKLAFTLLCFAKLWNCRNELNNNWTNTNRYDIKRSSKVNAGKQYAFLEGELYKRGLIEFAKSNTNLNCRVLFIDDSSKVVLRISDFRCLGYEYAKYKGADYIKCKKCGILFLQKNKGRGGRKQYCKDCSLEKKAISRIITCTSCGETVIIPAANRRSTMCPECYTRYRHIKKMEEQAERRLKQLRTKEEQKNEEEKDEHDADL